MVGTLKAWAAARTAIASAFDGVCDVFRYEDVTDPASRRTKKIKKAVYSGLPCRISYKNNNLELNKAQSSDTASLSVQKIKLFVPPDVEINAGSDITVTQNGVTVKYRSSGVPMRYMTHQEIILDVLDKYT